MTELALFGTDLFGEVIKPKASGPVAERFTLPPFTILDARTESGRNGSAHGRRWGFVAKLDAAPATTSTTGPTLEPMAGKRTTATEQAS